MSLVEINFDGIIGPSHNYAGLSAGNLASSKNAGAASHPRAAALQGIGKMRSNIRLGLTQGIFLPHSRPNTHWLSQMGLEGDAEPYLWATAMSASAMWAANAATASPAPDTGDRKCHLTPANLLTMAHRAHEWPGTIAQLRLAFAHDAFHVHEPVPAPFGDEGAANHMRLCAHHGAPGVEVFVYGVRGGRFPARQHVEASKAVARLHGVSTPLFVEQSEEAILADAIQSYLFNAQLVTLPGGGMALILPTEARDNARVWRWLQDHVAGNGPIRQLVPVDVRESMANGGGPACLRLRVVADPATVDPRFLVDEARLDAISDVVARTWPETIVPDDLSDPDLIAQIHTARQALVDVLGLVELSD